MKNKLLMLTAITASFTSVNATTIRDNTVELKGISNAEYNVQDENYFVTKNQPYNKRLEIENTDKGVKITFESGRKKSKEVVTQLEDYLLPQSIPLEGIAHAGKNMKPKKLNFVFSGELSFDKNGKRYRCENISLGQGHGMRNEWWFFTNIENPYYSISKTGNYQRNTIQFDCLEGATQVPFYATFNSPSSDKVSSLSITSYKPGKLNFPV